MCGGWWRFVLALSDFLRSEHRTWSLRDLGSEHCFGKSAEGSDFSFAAPDPSGTPLDDGGRAVGRGGEDDGTGSNAESLLGGNTERGDGRKDTTDGSNYCYEL